MELFIMVKKLPDRQLQNYSRLKERAREKSVTVSETDLKTRSDSDLKRQKWPTGLNRRLSNTLDRQEHQSNQILVRCGISILL